ncbi:TAP42-like protein [Coemansia reversa NRRL 1564]|uniref:TAP42-like protein n=1 Tax=Coemansia reversa (strain ATCC 12441 / NRRL 1564) TaxID=763665 RepID=A0A2G5BJH1_COERN|nr:TAP42-like protein [Coemansia reversa NRRL 1564]|eukprot:PIA19122.1 TAP42-like protein [Coemansia reversa NRRL 1564]
MNDNTKTEVPLGLGFARAQQQLKAINNTALASGSEEYQNMVSALVRQLRLCLDQIHSLSLFSSNESVDDYSTSELKLILANAYLGEVLQKVSALEGRVGVLEMALDHYQRFISTCQDLGIGGRPADKLSSEKQQLSLATASTTDETNNRTAQKNPGQNRMQKIERFKQLRAMQQEISELETRLAGDSDDGEVEDMEEVEREYAVKLLVLKIHQVTDDMEMLEKEIEMAKQMEMMRRADSDSRRPDGDSESKKDSNEWRLDSRSYQSDPRDARPMFNNKGQPTRPFVLTNERQRIKDGVFRPGWALPTMTVDEYLQQEQERGNIISGGGKDPEPKAEIDDNDHDALDAEVIKQREWDDFRDDNPKGWGNRGGNRG